MIKEILIISTILSTVLSEDLKARVYIFPASDQWPSVSLEPIGSVDFVQKGDTVHINGSVKGLSPGKHGFHVHQYADMGNKCVNMGPHFNPHKKDHGAPSDKDRHVGDLGNIESTGKETHISMQDNVISLQGENSIIGRGLVIHVGEDDLGRGNTPDSKKTGNAGARHSCGVIGLIDEPEHNSSKQLQLSVLTTVLISLILQLSKMY